jgi:hypothetical protein
MEGGRLYCEPPTGSIHAPSPDDPWDPIRRWQGIEIGPTLLAPALLLNLASASLHVTAEQGGANASEILDTSAISDVFCGGV